MGSYNVLVRFHKDYENPNQQQFLSKEWQFRIFIWADLKPFPMSSNPTLFKEGNRISYCLQPFECFTDNRCMFIFFAFLLSYSVQFTKLAWTFLAANYALTVLNQSQQNQAMIQIKRGHLSEDLFWILEHLFHQIG